MEIYTLNIVCITIIYLNIFVPSWVFIIYILFQSPSKLSHGGCTFTQWRSISIRSVSRAPITRLRLMDSSALRSVKLTIIDQWLRVIGHIRQKKKLKAYKTSKSEKTSYQDMYITLRQGNSVFLTIPSGVK